MDRHIDVYELIEAVQARQAIWDMWHEDYGDKVKRRQCWDEIVDLFVEKKPTSIKRQEMGHCLQKKWKNIRDRYSREVKMRRRRHGDTVKKPYIYFEELSFLTETVEMGRPITSYDGSDVAVESVDEERPGPSEKQVTRAKKTKRSPSETTVAQNLPDSSEKRERREEGEENDNRLFLLSLLPAMEFIPAHLKLVARVEMMQVINKYSVPSSYPVPLFEATLSNNDSIQTNVD